MEAGASHARPPAGVEAEAATYALLGGRALAGPAFASVYGGLALDPDVANWVGAGLGVGLRSAMRGRRRSVALTGLLSAFTMGDPTPYEAISARLIPEARFSWDGRSLIVRGYGGIGESEVTDRGTSPPAALVSDLWMLGGGLELNTTAGRTLVWAGAEAFETAGGTYLTAYAGSGGFWGPTRWNLGLRVWETPGDPELELALTLAVPLRSGWSMEASAGRSGPDPLLNSPAGVDGSVVVAWKAIDTGETPPVYTLAGGDSGTVVFRLKRNGAKTVSLMGDFSGWQPIAMSREGSIWLARVPVEPGLYHFGFLIDGDWYVPENAPGKVTDDFGRVNATLVVPVTQ